MKERQFSRSGGERSLYRACLLRGMRARAPRAENPWPEDHVIDLVLRAAQDPTSMATAPELAPVMTEFLAGLTEFSAAAALFVLCSNLSFGNAGSLAVPMISELDQADWVREGAPIPVLMGVTELATMSPYKMATIIALTAEMMASGSAEAMMRQKLQDNVGPSLDRSLFSAAAGVPGLRPPGILNGVTPLAASADPNMNERMIQDVEALVTALAAYGGNGRIAIIAPVKQSVRLKKFVLGETGYPVFVANQPNLIAVASAALAVAIDPPSIDTSSEAVFHLDDTPLPIADGGVMATPVRSAWQEDSIGLRFRLPVSWVLRAPAVSFLVPTW
jgi:hypothetical protein